MKFYCRRLFKISYKFSRREKIENTEVSTSGMLKRAARALRLASSGSSSCCVSSDTGAESAGAMDVVVCALINIQIL